MSTPWKQRLSHTVGWLADRKVPKLLRRPVYGGYCLVTGADAGEAQLSVRQYPSLGAFFVRRLRPGARTWDPDPDALPAPCDGRVQDLRQVQGDTLLQAKGRDYPLSELLGDAALARSFEEGWAWTIYLSPRDYHRVHTPLDATLTDVRWIAGARHSVAPKVLARRPRVFVDNERAVLRLETAVGPAALVMVGALNVGRIRVVGVEPGASPANAGGTGRQEGAAPRFARGDELARFEMGSTIVLVLPPGSFCPRAGLGPEDPVRMGEPIGRLDPERNGGA